MDKHDETYEILMVKALDGMLLPEEEEVWEAHLARCPECRQEFESFARTRDVMDEFRVRMLSEREQRLQSKPMPTSNRLAVVLVVLGVLLMWGFSAWHVMVAPEVPWPLRLGHGLVLLGMTVGLLVVSRDRWRTLKTDPYAEVDR